MKNPLFYLFCLSLLWLSAACSDDEHVPTAGDGTLTLRIPASLSTRAGEGEDASGGSSDTDATSELESGEGTVKDLWFMAYPTETGKGETLVRRLPTSSLPENSDYQEFSLTLKYGTYHVYVAANLPNISATTSKDDLTDMVLSFQTGTGSSATPQLPSTAQGLPMFKDCGEITISETGSKEITADLVFLCAKVKLTLEFDNTDYSKNAFGTNGFHITEINLVGAAGTSKLFNETNHNPKNLISISPFSFIYPSSTGTDGNTTNSDPWALTKAATWTHSATFYLPEYYPENIDGKNPTYLEIKGTEIKLKSDGSGYEDTPVEHTYTLPLGGDAYDYKKTPTTSFKGGNLVRGTYYDLTAQISSTGKQSLDVKMDVTDWTSVDLQDFVLTTLWLSRTGIPEDKYIADHNVKIDESEAIKVTSSTSDFINYETNAPTITVECVTKLTWEDDEEEEQSAPIILSEVDEENKKIIFHINPSVPYDAYLNKLEGTAIVAVKANNLIKYVDVSYDVSPYLMVTPLEVEIWTEKEGAQTLYAVSYETNMGGIRIPSLGEPDTDGKIKGTLKAPDGKGTVSVWCDTPSQASGTIYLQADANTENTWETSFIVYAAAELQNITRLGEEVKVIVRPPLGDYIIHFIAINDSRALQNGQETAGANIPRNGGIFPPTNNWNWDGWKEHNIYIYTQYGMTLTEIPNSVWYFFDTSGLSKPYWPGVPMSKDINNPGWWKYNLAADYKGVCDLKTAPIKNPKPGETLIMFNGGRKTDNNDSYLDSHHRYSYDLEPGISLFDFSNREGWFVYDPTVSSYEFYSEKPKIELVTYTMYVENNFINNWMRNYGQNFSIWEYASTNSSDGFYYEKVSDTEWYKTTLKLWTIEGKEAKNITVKHQIDDDTKNKDYGVMFGGRRFENNTGYYDDNDKSWHEGVPGDLENIVNP